jgi:uncharacterized membrane protein
VRLAATILLAAGLALWLAGATSPAAITLNAGLLILMATPVVRLLWALVAEARAGEWRYVALGVVVVALLFGSYLVSRRGP